MSRGWVEELRHQVAVERVGKAVPVVARIRGPAAVKLGNRTLGLRNSRKQTNVYEAGIIERILEHQLELVVGGNRRELFIRAHGTEVRNDAKNAFGLLAIQTRSGGGDRIRGRFRVRRRRLV